MDGNYHKYPACGKKESNKASIVTFVLFSLHRLLERYRFDEASYV